MEERRHIGRVQSAGLLNKSPCTRKCNLLQSVPIVSPMVRDAAADVVTSTPVSLSSGPSAKPGMASKVLQLGDMSTPPHLIDR